MLVIAADTEAGAPLQVFIPRSAARCIVVNPDVQHVHTPLILAVVAAHIGFRPCGFHDDGDPVQLSVARMKDVTPHLTHRGATIAVEGGSKIRGDRLRRAALDLVSVNEVHDFPIPKQRH